ncbi:uncharacterized protein RHO25_011360 [Cercospora beticola]|uniref:MARVEL domain-containing protein n=1 Tax=Cercospora beticola TaxID=122368 RepID=A0ABZ0P4H4_CERBT|nr:hypothetical protein RHO25_011360 [Cercospora beticola]CAK1366615.1 unnamed protein product [Cercospora beticola]
MSPFLSFLTAVLSLILSPIVGCLLIPFGPFTYDFSHRIIFGQPPQKDSQAEAYFSELMKEVPATEQNISRSNGNAVVPTQSEGMPPKLDPTVVSSHDASLPPPLDIGSPPESSCLYDHWFGSAAFLYIGLTSCFAFLILWQEEDALAVAKASTAAFVLTACFDVVVTWVYLLNWMYANRNGAARGEQACEDLHGRRTDDDREQGKVASFHEERIDHGGEDSNEEWIDCGAAEQGSTKVTNQSK